MNIPKWIASSRSSPRLLAVRKSTCTFSTFPIILIFIRTMYYCRNCGIVPDGCDCDFDKCDECGGKGYIEWKVDCNDCGGSGIQMKPCYCAGGCEDCDETGEVEMACNNCGGRGLHVVDKDCDAC